MDAVSGNQVKPGPMAIGARNEATANSCGSISGQAEQILFVGAVAMQQDKKRLAGPFLLRLGPLDDRGGEGVSVSHGTILTVTRR